MGIISDLKDQLIRKISTSLFLKALDGHKLNVSRCAQALNLLIAALYLAVPVIDTYAGTDLAKNVDFINDKWLIAVAALSHAGIELGIADKKAKERLGIK